MLGRPIDSAGQATYGQMLANGASRSDIALTLLHSAEGSQYRVERDYRWLLHRAADPNGLEAYSQLLAHGGSEETVGRILLSSDEFYGQS